MEFWGTVILLGSNVLVALITHTASLRKAKVDQTTQLLEAQNKFLNQVREEYTERIRQLETKVNRYETHVSSLEADNSKLKRRVQELEIQIKELQSEREALLKQIKGNG